MGIFLLGLVEGTSLIDNCIKNPEINMRMLMSKYKKADDKVRQ